MPPGSVACMAPTGRAAVLLPLGTTAHRFCQIKSPYVPANAKRLDDEERRPYQRLALLIIDEISMMRCDLLDHINAFMMANGPCPGQPFGGCALVMVGDPYQLPPVVTDGEKSRFAGEAENTYRSPFFFDAIAWQRNSFRVFTLTERVRFTNDAWGQALSLVRVGDISDFELDQINRECTRRLPNDDSFRLYTTNAAAEQYNHRRLEALDGTPAVYPAKIEGLVPPADLPTEEHLTLKVGARVMMIRNDQSGDTYQNGTLGEVIELGSRSVDVLLENGHTITVGPQVFDFYDFDRSKYDLTTDAPYPKLAEDGRVHTGKFEQLPVKLAWASTIHRAQGLTVDKAHVDLGRRAFAGWPNLCRICPGCAAAKDSAWPRPIRRQDIFQDSRVDDFFRALEGGKEWGQLSMV